MAETLIRTLHLLGAAGLAAGIVIAILGAGSLGSEAQPAADDSQDSRDNQAERKTIGKVYLFTALAALTTLGGGFALWLGPGKPAAFFSNNPVFHAKLGLFAILLCLLVWPAWYFTRRQQADRPIPSSVIRLQKAAIPVLLIIPVLAYLMARGIGY